MKKILLTLCTVILAVTLQAQEHMAFKGVSMGINITSFVSQLEAKGFTVEHQSDNGVLLKGDFAGRSACTVIVLPTKASKKVWKVVVQFPKKTSWYSLKSEYKTFKESYTEKYGKPESYEFFSRPYEEGDGYEMTALSVDKCTYASYYKIPEGTIGLEISDDKCVTVAYEDAITTAIRSKEKETSVSEVI